MRLDSCLLDHAVLQRNRANVSEAAFTGTAATAGAVLATVRRGGKTVPGLVAKRIGTSTRGKVSGCLKGIPAGGPYEVELVIADAAGAAAERVVVRDVLVGDVWMLGGQSNMQGVGTVNNGLKIDPLVRAWYMDDRWAPAKDPIHNMFAAVDQVHADLCGGTRPGKPGEWCAGPGVAFAQRMREITGVPQGVIASGHGGTSMNQWDPKRKSLGGKSLYGAMLRRLRVTGGGCAGMVWYQGCSDANATDAPLYTARMKALVAAIRKDFHAADLPFVLVQIARVVGWGTGNEQFWNSVQDQERRLPSVIRRCLTVPAIDLPLDDSIHISGEGQVRLGRRLAQAMDCLLRGAKAGKLPITLKRVTVAPVAGRGVGEAILEFDNVEGALQSGSRPSGFSIVSPNGASNIFDVKLQGNRAVLRSGQSPVALAEMSVHYGFGSDPYCNVTDAKDRSLPVFGPVALGTPRAVLPPIRTFRVSAFLPSAGKLDGLKYPADLTALDLKPYTGAEPFATRRPEIVKHGAEDALLYYACAFECPEAMRLAVLVGYDGPVKLWLDGRELLHDANGTNPAIVDGRQIPVRPGKGRHEILVALGTNDGAAWGIFLRLERLDVPARLLRKGAGAYAMPQVLG